MRKLYITMCNMHKFYIMHNMYHKLFFKWKELCGIMS